MSADLIDRQISLPEPHKHLGSVSDRYAVPEEDTYTSSSKNQLMPVIGVCGKLCDKCPVYGVECEGCIQEMKFSSRYTCEVYRCAVSKGLDSCTGCTEYDCLITTKHRSLCPLLVEKAAQPVARRVQSPDSPVQ